MRPLSTQAGVIMEAGQAGPTDQELVDVMDRILSRYGRNGSGRASALRLIGAYMIFQAEGAAGFRQRGFSRMTIQLYRDRLSDANVRVR